MSDKILFFLDKEWLHFGIAKLLKEKYDCELFAVIDLDKPSSKFIHKQKLVNFNKIWDYRDFVLKSSEKPDIEYLRNFEEKYGINLWEIAYSERFFIHYNPYYKFTSDEILLILEKECKLFENILSEVNPDYLIIKITDSHQSHLLHQLCKIKGTKSLMLGWTRFGYRCSIYDEYDKFMSTVPLESKKKRTVIELQNYLKSFHSSKAYSPWIATKHSIFFKFQKYIQSLVLLNSKDIKNFYPFYGRNIFKIITQFIFLKKPYRKSFIDKNFLKKIEKDQLFIYYPLHAEPERALLLVAPYFTDQLELITNVAKSIPIGYKLYVKEHKVMGLFGWRNLSFYKKILEHPNVKLFHPSANVDEMLDHCSLVVGVGGATGLEAAFHGKPSIVFSDVSYSSLPSVSKIENIDELPITIRKHLEQKVDYSALNDYVNLVEENTFEIDLIRLTMQFEEFFSKEFTTVSSNIPEKKMKLFLDQHSKEFELLALEHIKKIKEYKKSFHL